MGVNVSVSGERYNLMMGLDLKMVTFLCVMGTESIC